MAEANSFIKRVVIMMVNGRIIVWMVLGCYTIRMVV